MIQMANNTYSDSPDTANGGPAHTASDAGPQTIEEILDKLGSDTITPQLLSTFIKSLSPEAVSDALTKATASRKAIQQGLAHGGLPLPDLLPHLKASPGFSDDKRNLMIELLLANQLQRFQQNKHRLPISPRDLPTLIRASFDAQKKLLMENLLQKRDTTKNEIKNRVDTATRKLNFVKNTKIRMFSKQLALYAQKNPLDALKHFAYGISLMNTNNITGKPLRVLRNIRTYKTLSTKNIEKLWNDLAKQITTYASYPELIQQIKGIADNVFNPTTNPMPGVVRGAFAVALPKER